MKKTTGALSIDGQWHEEQIERVEGISHVKWIGIKKTTSLQKGESLLGQVGLKKSPVIHLQHLFKLLDIILRTQIDKYNS